MKLSELLALNPTLDVDLKDKDGDLYLDGVYLFRKLVIGDEPGDSTLQVRETDHTDWVVKMGLLQGAYSSMAASWHHPDED